MLDPNMELSEAEKLTNELSSAMAAVSSLHGEVQSLQTHMHRVRRFLLDTNIRQNVHGCNLVQSLHQSSR